MTPNLCGWIKELVAPEYARLAENFISFHISGNANEKPGKPIWEFSKKLNKGQHLPTWNQKTGDCVSMGVVQAGQYLSAYEIAKLWQEEVFRLWFPPFVYATSRVQVGRGQLGRRAGSTGAWAAAAVMKYGILFCDDQGTPQYSGSLADQWGYSGAPDSAMKIAVSRPIKSAAKLSSVADIRTALINYKPVTYAIDFDYGVGEKIYKDYHIIYRDQLLGGHQICLIAWMDDPFPAAYLLNSWGTKNPNNGSALHGTPRHGEPPGGAWLPADLLEEYIADAEIYALSTFEGFKGEADYGILANTGPVGVG